MECDCSIDCDVDEFCFTLSDEYPTARKQHKCGECGRIIEAGKKYRKEKLLNDGEITTQKTCLDCNSIRKEFFDSFYYGMIRECFVEHVQDCYGEVPEKCLSKLTPNALAWACDVIERVWEDNAENE